MYIEIKDKWNQYLQNFKDSQKDIYFTEEYLSLAAGTEEKPLCAVCSEGENILLLPFLRRKVKEYYDFETPYGYGGPVTNCSDNSWNEKTLRELISYFSHENYLAGFIRFHPLLNNAEMCRTIFTVIDDRKTVAIDTSESQEEIWQKQISSKNRNMIRKSEKNGLVFERDNDFKYIKEFKNLYNTTMNRLDASDFYYFDEEYYAKFINIFNNKGFIGCIKKDSEIISAALFMYGKEFGHYHLAGSNRNYSSLGANNLLLWKSACEMNKEGVKEFHLGGGTDGSEENSLFKFKHSFSTNLKQFSIGKVIFNKVAYEQVCMEWENKNPEKKDEYKNILLKYRY